MKTLAPTSGYLVTALLDQACERDLNAVFVSQDDTVQTYGDVRRHVDALTLNLQASGIPVGGCVLIVNHDPLETVHALFAASRAGAVFCVIDEHTSARNLRHIIDDCRPYIIFAEQLPEELPGYEPFLPNSRLNAFRRIEINKEHWPRATDFSAIVYTSGSTGRPKGVALTGANIAFSVGAIHGCLGYRREDVVAVYLPLSFDYALYQIFLACHVGCALVLRKTAPTSALIVSALQRDRVTVFPSVPSLSAALATALKHRGSAQTLHRLVKLSSTGQLFPPALLDELQTLLPQLCIYPMYGLTECKRIAILLPQEHAQRRGSVGRPLPGTQVEVVSDKGERLPPGQFGQFVVEGEHVATYWPGTAENDGVFEKRGKRRFLFTGDYGYIDADGYLYWAGRRDGIVKRRAMRISLAEIENCLRNQPGIVLTAVVFDPSSEKIIAFVVPEHKSTVGVPDSIFHRLRELLEAYKLPDHIVQVDSLPLNSNRKVDRQALLAQWRAQYVRNP
jgi:acyl-CoA synthetase (AMP-forming)/AMP-acid ligase II